MLHWIKSLNLAQSVIGNWSKRRQPEHSSPADLFDDRSMSFGEHIEELRNHLWRAIYGIIFFFLASFFFADHVVMLLTAPVEKELKEW